MVPIRTIFHVDMDAFFASVEIREAPQLRGQPVLVGGVGRRGVVAAASYEARKFGCHSAQPMVEALRRCPHAVVLPGRHGLYSEVSEQVFTVFAEFSPRVQGLSIDEAFLDMSGTERLLGPPRAAAEALQARVAAQTGGLTCSVGIAPNLFIAKIASGLRKPAGITQVEPGTERQFLAPLAVEQLWGVGPKTAARLRARRITTVGEIAQIDASTMRQWFGEHGAHLHRLASGIDPREVEPWRETKQVGHENTYEIDVAGEAALLRKLLEQASRVADRLIVKGWVGRRVQLKLRDTTFRTELRQCTLPEATDDTRVIYQALCSLLAALDIDGRRFRLTGVSVGGLEERAARGTQLELAIEPDASGRARHELQRVMSAVRGRFGNHALFPAEAGGNQARSQTPPGRRPKS